MDRAEYGWLEQALDQPIADGAPAEWGLRNRTDLLTLADGERLVLQRYRSPDDAEHRLRTMRLLWQPAAERGIAIPHIRRFDLDADPAWILFDALPGVPVAASDEIGPASSRFAIMAEAMGELLAGFRRLPSAGLDIGNLWADPPLLAARAGTWADRLTPRLTPGQRAEVDRIRSAHPALFADRRTVLAHGDFAPVNILTDGETITGLLDFESVRLADRLFDVAWWAWSMSLAGQDILDAAWPAFLSGAGIDPAESGLMQRIRALQVFRMLELLTEQTDLSPAVRNVVQERLLTMLG